MMKIAKGSFVRFAGDPGEKTPDIGDLGRIIAVNDDRAEVMWRSGARRQTSTKEYLDDLVPDIFSRTPQDIGQQVSATVKEAPANLYKMLKKASALPTIRQEVTTYVMTRLNQDPYVLASIDELDDAQKSKAILHLATSLLKDEFGKGS